jgi:hypothetical protein
VTAGPPSNSNPYSRSPVGAAPSQPSRPSRWLWILGGLGAAGFAVCLCCGLGAWLSVASYEAFITDELKKEFIGDDRIARTLGKLESASIRWSDSVAQTQQQATGNTFLVVEAEGSSGQGRLTVELSPNGQPSAMFEHIELKTASGDEIAIK